MLVIAVSFSTVVYAYDEPTVTLDHVVSAPGDTVTVKIYIENCPDIKSMAVTPIYDESILTLESGKWILENASLMDNWSEETGNAVLAFSSPTNINGEIFELVFSVGNNVSDCSTPIGCEIVLVNGTVTYSANVVNGSVDIKSVGSEITSVNMVLGTDITINYYATLDDSHAGAQMRFTMNGTETVVDGVETEKEGVYAYAFQKVAPQCMGDTIKAELILGDTVLAVKENYSVKAYCEDTLAMTAAELEMSEEKYAALRTLIADLLEYGAKAQIYQDYKTDRLVNQRITGQSEFVELNPEDCDEILEQSGSFTLTGVEFVSAGLYFDYYNALYVKFNAPSVSDSNFRVRVKDGEENILATYKLADCQLISEESNTYLLILPALYATQFEEFYIIELCKYSSRATTMQWSLNYGVSSYVCAKQNQTDDNGDLTPMAELARATYNYGLSAGAYHSFAN